MVTAPCPYRMVEFNKDKDSTRAVISSRFITSIPSLGDGFDDYAADYVFKGTKKLVNTAMADRE